MKKHTVTVTGYNSGGEGVSRLDDGRVVFIRGAAREDVLEIELIKEHAKLAWAKIINIISPSQYRIESDCSFYPECGGCNYRHITYEEELFAKLQCVNDALLRIGGLSISIDRILHTGRINGYRNKVVLHSNGFSFGFYRAQSNYIIPVDRCLLLKDDLNEAVKLLSQSDIDSENVVFRSGRNGLEQPLEEMLDGLIYKLKGFFQVNTDAALMLFQKAREYAALSKSDILIDLYCGVGALTLFVGRDAGYALGVENNPGAVKTAKENALRNNLRHIEFIDADAAHWDLKITDPDCVIVDPPRKGLSPEAIKKVLSLSPKRLVYISCNPATLARDLKALTDYTITEICAVDMFPRTANIECCCLMIKNETDRTDG